MGGDVEDETVAKREMNYMSRTFFVRATKKVRKPFDFAQGRENACAPIPPATAVVTAVARRPSSAFAKATADRPVAHAALW
jgi:hypothetical protein